MKRIIGLLIFIMLTGNSFAQVDAEAFSPGYYINRKGNKVPGWIKYHRRYQRIEYTATADAKKTIYVMPYNCREFVMDSVARFVICPRPVTVRYGGWNRLIHEDFLQVFAEGKISLYKHYDEVESKTKLDFTPTKVESVIIRKGNSSLLALTDDEEKNREKLEALFPKERGVVKALMGKDWDETIKFVREYNAK
jgi:hypothetical protein